MKITLLTPAFAAILGLALASAPVTLQAQTDTTTAPAATTAPAPTPAPASTAKPAKPKKNPQYSGALTAVDTTANTVTVATPTKKDPTKSLTLNIASTAKIMRNKKPATLADFAVGEKVGGSYTKDASGTMTAVTLSFNTPKTKAPKTEATPATPAATTTAPAAAPAPAPADTTTAAPAPTTAPAMPAGQ